MLKHPKLVCKCICPFILHPSFLNHPISSKNTITFLLRKVCGFGLIFSTSLSSGAVGSNLHPLYIYKLKNSGVENIQRDCASVPLQKALRKDPRQGTPKMKVFNQLPQCHTCLHPPFRAIGLIHSYLQFRNILVEQLQWAKHCFAFDDGGKLVNKTSKMSALMKLAF